KNKAPSSLATRRQESTRSSLGRGWGDRDPQKRRVYGTPRRRSERDVGEACRRTLVQPLSATIGPCSPRTVLPANDFQVPRQMPASKHGRRQHRWDSQTNHFHARERLAPTRLQNVKTAQRTNHGLCL